MRLIIGLGNPGRAYANNRHNVGFMCLNRLAKIHGLSFSKKQGRARIARGEIANAEVVLAKPQTYVNLSGEASILLMHRFNVPLSNLLVIHDDLDLPPGKIRVRRGGSSSGHKGLISLIDNLGGEDFARVRVGIGRPARTEESSKSYEERVISYVLSDFTHEEKVIIEETITTVADAIYCILTEGISEAMNKYNSFSAYSSDKNSPKSPD